MTSCEDKVENKAVVLQYISAAEMSKDHEKLFLRQIFLLLHIKCVSNVCIYGFRREGAGSADIQMTQSLRMPRSMNN